MQTAFNGAIKLGILLLVLSFLGVHPGWGGLLIPAGLFALVLTGTAVGLALTSLGVLYGDIGRGTPLITTGWTAALMRLNPLTPLIFNARAWRFTGQPPQLLGDWALAVGGSLVVLLLVWMVVRLAMSILIERMNA
ncbi:MAG: hypothetical protein VKM34_11895 [Cyanobacteriota bacterium]|nr:hypothetical protein [Cyanobacteriota bacterium]